MEATRWPDSSCTPSRQLRLTCENHSHDENARIPTPKNAQQLWAQHKYSILARDANFYRQLGPRVARLNTDSEYSDLANELTYSLRRQPSEGGLRNAAQHMWGHVSGNKKMSSNFVDWPISRLLDEIKHRAVDQDEYYLLHSTALTELETWVPD